MYIKNPQQHTRAPYIYMYVQKQGIALYALFVRTAVLATLALLSTLTFAQPAHAAFGTGGATCTAQSKTAGTTLTCTVATENLEAGNVAVLVFGADNIDTTDTTTNLLSSVTDSAGNAWIVQSCFTNGQGSAGTGATSCVATSKLTTALTSGAGTITANFTSVTAKSLVVKEFTTPANIQIAGSVQTLANDGADPGAMTVGSLPSGGYLFVRASALERATGGTWTVTANHTSTGCNGTTGAGAVSNMDICGETRIVTSTTTVTSNPTGTAVDVASVFLAFKEAPMIISGTLYADEGITAITTSKTIKIAIGTSTPSITATSTSATGAWSITVPTNNLKAGTTIIAWVDADATTRASVVTKLKDAGVTGVGELDLYKNNVIVRQEDPSATSTKNIDMGVYDGDNDSDIRYAVNGSNNLTVFAGNKLYVRGSVFVPGGIVTVGGNASTTVSDGSLTLNSPYRDLTTATNTQKSFIVNSQDGNPVGLSFSADGSKMYMLGSTNNTVYQYTLATAYDVSTASYASKAFSIAAQETGPGAVSFSADGTKMFIVGAFNDTVYQYTLSTAWDVSTASYASKSFSFASQDPSPAGLTFSSDGKKMYENGNTNDTVYQYTLSTAWDVSTASYASKSLYVGNQAASSAGVVFNTDGTKMYAPDAGAVYEYSLGVPYDVSTGQYTNKSAVTTASGYDIARSSDGVYIYLIKNTSSTVQQYKMGTVGASMHTTATTTLAGSLNIDVNSKLINDAKVIFNATTTGKTITTNGSALGNLTFNGTGGTWALVDAATTTDLTVVTGTTTAPSSLTIGGNFTHATGGFVAGAATRIIPVGYDASTASYTSKSFSAAAQETSLYDVAFNLDGTLMYGVGVANSTIYQYTLSTPYDVTTATYASKSKSIATQSTQPTSVVFKSNGLAMYVYGYTNRTVYQYTLSTAWDISTATYISKSLALASQSLNTLNVTLSSDGTKLYAAALTDPAYEYTLSTAWDVSTASYYKSYSVAAQGLVAFALIVTTDGSKMYINDGGSSGLYQYSLSTPYDISTATYTNKLGNIGSDSPRGFVITNDGTKVTIARNTTNIIDQYTLGANQTLSGNMKGTSAFQDMVFGGSRITTFLNNASTTNFTIANASTAVVAPSKLTIGGNYTNSGRFTSGTGTLAFIGADDAVATGTLTGASTFNILNVQKTNKNDGITWTARSAAGNDDQWLGIAYGNGLFVAVDNVGDRVMTSPDGITWTARSAAGNDDQWLGITYGNSLFVAVGSNGDRVMTSPDGITWTARSAAGNDDGWQAIAYGNGLFVAVGYTGDRVMTSPDGITWTARSAGANYILNSITYGNGLFVAVSTGSGVMTSPDGITWTARSAAGDNDYWYGITYGNSLFVAVGSNGDRVMTSPDGITWTARSAAGNDDSLRAITYGNGLFLAVGEFGDRVIISPDGITWTARTAAGDNDSWRAIAYANGLFVAVGYTGDRVMTSASISSAPTPLTFGTNASTTALTISASSTVVAPSKLTIGGNYTNSGRFTAGKGMVHIKSPDAYDVSTAVYANKSFSVLGTAPIGIAFSTDGTKMYVIDNSGDIVYQYILSTAFDVSTASYASKSFSVGTQENFASGLSFSTDGTRMYVVGATADTINQYTLSTAWDISTASYASKNKSVTGQASNPTDLYLSAGGDAMFVADNSGYVFQYTLSVAYDISTATYANKNVPIVNRSAAPDALTFNAAGTKMHIATLNEEVFEYNLSTAWDLSTASFAHEISVATFETGTNGIALNPQGTAMYLIGVNGRIVHQYTLAGPQPQTLSGSMLGTSALYNVIISNASTTTFSAPAVVHDFTIATSSRKVIFPTSLTIGGNYTNRASSTVGTSTVFIGPEGYDVATASYASKSFSVASQETLTQGVTFSIDGTKMFVLGLTNKTVYQYTLATAYDVTTASYISKNKSVNSQDTAPTDLVFSSDGTKMYVLGDTNNTVYQYTLATAYDVSTASYASKSFSVASQISGTPGQIVFSSDGTKMYATGGNTVYQYTLSTPWDISSASYASKSFSVASWETGLTSAFLNHNGTAMYALGGISDSVFQFKLSTPYDISTASYANKSFQIRSQEETSQGLAFAPDGTKMYMVGLNNTVYQYRLGTSTNANQTLTGNMTGTNGFYDVRIANASTTRIASDFDTRNFYIGSGRVTASTTLSVVGDFVKSGRLSATSSTLFMGPAGYRLDNASYSGKSKSVSGQEGNPTGAVFNSDGTKMYVTGYASPTVYQYTLATAWDVSTASYASKSFSVSAQDTLPSSLIFTPDGTKLYMLGANNVTAYQYTLSTAWDISTASYASKSFSFAGQGEGNPTSMKFDSSGTKLYMLGSTQLQVFQYTLSTAWDISTVSYASKSFSVSGQETAPSGLGFNISGTMMFVIGYITDSVYQYKLSTPYDISTARYANKSLSVSAQGDLTFGLAFSQDGTKMYRSDYNTSAIYQYTLGTSTIATRIMSGDLSGTSALGDIIFSGAGTTTILGNVAAKNVVIGGGVVKAPSEMTIEKNYTNTGRFFAGTSTVYLGPQVFDISTASYANKSFSVASQENGLSTHIFSSDGTKMFVLGFINKTVYQYTLSTAYDISTASYASKSFSVNSQDTSPRDIFFSSDGTKMYMLGYTNKTLYQYTLSIAWDVSTASYASKSFSVNSQDTQPVSFVFSSDGTKMYVVGVTSGNVIYQYTLATPYDVSTASYASKSFSVASQDSNTVHLTINSGGSKMYIISPTNGTVYQYALSTPYNISTASYSAKSFYVGGQIASPQNIFISPDGTKMYLSDLNSIYQYTLSNTSPTQQVLSGNLSGSSAFKNLTVTNTSGTGSSTQAVWFASPVATAATYSMWASTSAAFPAGATSTLVSINLAGTSQKNIYMRSAKPGTKWGLTVTGVQTAVSYVNVRDSNACSGNTILADDGTNYNAGNDTCWLFPIEPTFASAGNQSFVVGQATTSISTITITEDPSAASITAANDIRFVIATSTVRMKFDTTDTSVVLGGTAAGKVSGTVSYEGGGSILVLNVTSDFAVNDTLTISGLSYAQFTAVNASRVALGLRLDGVADMLTNAFDSRTVTIGGGLTVANHDMGQVINAFSGQGQSAVKLFAFKLSPTDESITISSLVFSLSGIRRIDSTKLSNLLLYRDNNANGLIDGADTALGGNGALVVTEETGTITFSNAFTATTSRNYLMIGDITRVKPNEYMTVSLSVAGSVTGVTSLLAITPTGSVTSVQHVRGGGGGGSSAEVGGSAPVGAGIQSGGTGGGGVALGGTPGFVIPSVSGAVFNEWITGSNGMVSDDTYATAVSTNLRESYSVFGFSVPTGNTVTGIEVKLEASGSTAAGTIDVALSWNGDSSITATKSTGVLTGSDAIYTLGSPSDTWGRTWTPSEFGNANFFIRVIAQPNSNTVKVDAMQVRPYHVSGGAGAGGSGGGGAI